MDYASEQQMELEALEAIYMDELQVYDGDTPSGGWPAAGNTYKIVVTPQEDGEDGLAGADELEMELLFAHTAKYPEEAPCLKLRSSKGLSDADIERCYRMLMDQVEENKGMPMIYTLVTAAKEWLRGRAAETQQETPEQAQRRLAAEDEAKRAAIRAMGTMVTPENFREWKAKFDAEQRAAKAKALEGLQDTDKARRLTGKQWFMQDKNQAYKEQQHEDEDSSDEDYYDGEHQEGGYASEGRRGLEAAIAGIDFDSDDDEGMLDGEG
uniref:RWD domain-containing protein n=1 Tax=Dunaliella tertiolecta TaxID=3047 RepID=A0A7S3QYE3_DUNTE|mmetsp:Transcript_315/g.749  ORF Transcript_315/g.749 Transcript_315/m.749 type:complete len:267 (+) Transcript_315:76-876(+)